MTTSTESLARGEHVISEGNGTISRSTATLISGQNLVAGTVLGIITASSKLTRCAHGASDGSQSAIGVLFGDTNATAGDVAGVVYTSRLAELRSPHITFSSGASGGNIATQTAALLALNIVLR